MKKSDPARSATVSRSSEASIRPWRYRSTAASPVTVITTRACGFRRARSESSSLNASSEWDLTEYSSVTRRVGSAETAWRSMLRSGVMPMPPASSTTGRSSRAG